MSVDTLNTKASRQNATTQIPRRSGTSKTDAMLAVSDTIVSTLKGVGTLSGLPFIQEAASVALTILAILQVLLNYTFFITERWCGTFLQNVRQNKDEFLRLANDVCEITYTAALMCNEYEKKHQPISERTKEDLKELVRSLSSPSASIRA